MANTGWDKVEDHGVVVARTKEADGSTIDHVRIVESQDLTPILTSLPQGKCVCPHWGYVLAGRLTARYDDGSEETYEAGEPYYLRAGHTTWKAEAGSEVVQFSPTDLLAEVDAAIHEVMSRSRPGDGP